MGITHSSHTQSFNVPVWSGLTRLDHMLNEYDICLNRTNYPLCKILDIGYAPHFGLFWSAGTPLLLSDVTCLSHAAARWMIKSVWLRQSPCGTPMFVVILFTRLFPTQHIQLVSLSCVFHLYLEFLSEHQIGHSSWLYRILWTCPKARWISCNLMIL